MKNLDEIKQMMAAGDTAQANEVLKELLAAEPNNLQAKMLYGICSQLRGDEKTFRRIYDELAPKMEKLADADASPAAEIVVPPEAMTLWRKYHTLWMILVGAGLVLAGGVLAVAYFGKTISRQALAAYAGPRYESHETVQRTLYGGPRMEERQIEARDKFSPDVKSVKDFSDAK